MREQEIEWHEPGDATLVMSMSHTVYDEAGTSYYLLKSASPEASGRVLYVIRLIDTQRMLTPDASPLERAAFLAVLSHVNPCP